VEPERAAEAVDKDRAKEAKDPDPGAEAGVPEPPATAFARNAGRQNRTNAAYPASSANARSAASP
jgi:hypothetical protein